MGLSIAGNTDSLRSLRLVARCAQIEFALVGQEILPNRISVFFALDVIVSAVVYETAFSMDLAAALLLAGVSLALPLLLYLRESAVDQSRPQALASEQSD